MTARFLRLSAFGVAVFLCAQAWAGPAWKLTRTEHFELYSQAGDEVTRPLLNWFEQLRAFYFAQPLFKLPALPPLRVIVFASEKDYEPFRLRATSDAYYAGGTSGHYIAMPAGSVAEFRIAAHEFAHFVLYSSGFNLAPWLNEGLAEALSTVRLSETGYEVGGDLPVHTWALRRHNWMPLADLLSLPPESRARQDRDSNALFYAESWALAQMLLLSPDYTGHFSQLIASAGQGRSSAETLQALYGKSPQTVESDLRDWVDKHAAKPIRLPGVAAGSFDVHVSEVTTLAAQTVLADLLVTGNELDRAAALYREIAREAPTAADISAALGTIALRKGDATSARELWKQAIEQGVANAELCYQYAVLADAAGLGPDQIRPALERAVSLRPDFDDARYKLALIEKNAGHWQAALAHFRAMRKVAPVRAYSYWSAVADTLNQLDDRDGALDAARRAADHAGSADERARAAQLAYFAQTDMTVQFVSDSAGRAQMVTTRIPHEASDWNPFIEAGDDLRRVHGVLQEIDCGHGATRLRVDAAGTTLMLVIADPSRVRMRNAPEEFVCGPQSANSVVVEYAASKRSGADGLIRGIEFDGSK